MDTFLNSQTLAEAFGVTPRTLAQWMKEEREGGRNLGINAALVRDFPTPAHVFKPTKQLIKSIKILRSAKRLPAWQPQPTAEA